MTNHHLFGIRHHGPGSSRSLVRALDQLLPDLILVEGPPEADHLIPFVSSENMRPPVALLIYAADNPNKAVFYPFAPFSPEWCAMLWAVRNSVPVQFNDLPQSNHFAVEDDETLLANANDGLSTDPLRLLAEAAGYDDSERWWDAVIEHRRDDNEIFNAIREAMTALRAEVTTVIEKVEPLREAYMRQTIRKAKRDGFKEIAIVCGAWHVPALANLDGHKQDSSLLSGLPKVKTAATWVPWTNSRLSYRSGYGAGITSPGWYAHLWSEPENVTASWMTKVAHLFREHDLPSSPAHIIEAVRLAETLSALREKSVPSLNEMNDSVKTVFCFGGDIELRLISDKLIIGDELGSIPEETPMVPLQQDFDKAQKRLRLPIDTERRTLELDLRNANDLEKSKMLHRANLLGIPWGKTERVTGAKGTFREAWQLQWQPEFVIALIEASMWGNTVLDAAEAKTIDLAKSAPDLPSVTDLLAKALLAELPLAVHKLIERLKDESALSTDVQNLMRALPALVKVLRYGNVRNTEAALITKVVDGMVVRITLGLSIACNSLDDDSAAQMHTQIVSANAAINLLQNDQYLFIWTAALTSVVDQMGVHGLVAGRCCRILFDSGGITDDDCAECLSRALSLANDPLHSAAWIEGFLQDSFQLLLIHTKLLALVDNWLSSIHDDLFVTLLPLVRRTFSTFEAAERRQLGERIRSGNGKSSQLDGLDTRQIDLHRAESALPLLRLILGLDKSRAET